MALQRLNLRTPAPYQGLEDFAPPEFKPMVLELVRRLTVNTESQTSDLRAQVVVDTSILPDQSHGESEASTQTVSTSAETEQAMLLSMMWTG